MQLKMLGFEGRFSFGGAVQELVPGRGDGLQFGGAFGEAVLLVEFGRTIDGDVWLYTVCGDN